MSSKWQIFERSVIRTKHLWSQKPCFAYNNYRQKKTNKKWIHMIRAYVSLVIRWAWQTRWCHLH